MKHITTKNLLFLIVTAATLAMAAFIFGFSAQNGEESGALSEAVTQGILDAVYPTFESLPISQRETVFAKVHYLVRKTAHFSEYFVFGSLLLCWFHLFRPRYPVFRCAQLACLCGAGYAVLDEWHQGFVSGRQAALGDVLIDSMGVLTGVAILSAVALYLRNRKKRLEIRNSGPDIGNNSN